ncbi:MAG: hypothetical protein IKF36_03510 [Bacilli bacterium]|nr:hypothetical protein [Bacilli bacterium]
MNIENNYNKKNKMNRVIMIIGIILSTIVLLITVFIIGNTFFFKTHFGSMHSKEEFIDFIDNSTITVNNKELPTNLKGKYTIVDEKVNKDYEGNDVKEITININNTDLNINVYSGSVCIKRISLEGKNCRSYKYKLYFGHFNDEVMNYYIDNYNRISNYKLNKDNFYHINSKNDLDQVINGIDGFFQYLNKLDYRFIDESKGFVLYFTSDNNINGRISISYDIDNNSNFKPYIKRFEYAIDDKAKIFDNIEINDLKTNIYSLFNEKGIIFN